MRWPAFASDSTSCEGRPALLPAGLIALCLLAAGFVSGALAAPDSEIVVVGQVRRSDGPLAQARVELLRFQSPSERGRTLLGEPAPSAEAGALSDQDGWFRAAAPESGMWRLVATAPGFVPMEYPLVPLTDETDVPAVELLRDTGLQVRVLDEKSRPVAGAQILAIPDQPRDTSAPWRPEWQPSEQLRTTDAEGLALVPAGSEPLALRVEVSAPGFPAVVVSGVRRSHLDVRLARGVVQRVQVRDPRGRPAGKVLAWIEGMEMPTALSDPQGHLSLALPAGERTAVRFLGATGEWSEAHPSIRPGAEPKAMTVDLQAAQTITGRVVSLPGRSPLGGALVWTGRDWRSCVRTDRGGGYVLTLEPTRQGPIRAAATGYFEELLQVPLKTPGPSLALRPKSVLSGTVVDVQGRPVPGVEIRIRYDPAAVSRASSSLRFSGGLSRSRGTGRFRADSLVPGASYLLRFARSGFASRVVRARAPEPGGAAEPLRVELSAGLTAKGVVRDRQDRPIAGAVVDLQPALPRDTLARIRETRDPDPVLARSTITDENGRFELNHLGPGRFDLAARAGGFASTRIPGIEIPDGPGPFDLGTVLLATEAVVTGRVQDTSGRPLDGASVRIVPPEPLPGSTEKGEPEAVSDAAGWFQLRGQRSGDRLKLSVERSGYARSLLPGVPVPTEEPIAVVLSPTSRISGRVLDAASRPVSGAVIQATEERVETVAGMPVFGTGRQLETRSQEDGSFSFEGVEPGSIELTASGAQWQESSLRLRLAAGQDLEGVELTLHEAAILEGTVLGQDGTPVVGAEIGRHRPPRPGEMRIEAPLALSDADGRYRIDRLAPGRLSLSASHGVFGQAVQELDLQPGENALDFRLQGGQTVSGHVLDRSGSPVAAARIWMRASTGTLPEVLSEPDGAFRFEGIAPGSYLLEALKGGEGRTRQPVPLQISEAPLEEVVLELAATGTIRGRILGLSETELARVRISAGWAAGDSEVKHDGSYSIAGLAPGTWNVVAELPGTGRRAERAVTLDSEADAVLDLDFGEGLSLSGRVRRNGRPFSGGTVSLQGSASAPAWAETDSEGRFTLRGLVPGLYRLEISDYRTGLIQARQIQLQQDESVVLDFGTATLEGAVANIQDGQPLAQVELTLTSLEVGEGDAAGRWTVSSADGSFVFPEVAEGSWRLTASRPGYRPKEQVLTLGNPQTRIEVTLEPLVQPATTANGEEKR